MKKIGISIVVCAWLIAANGLAQNSYMPSLVKQSLKRNIEQLKSVQVASYPQHTVEYNWVTDWVEFRTIETSYKSFGEPDVIEYNQGGNRTRNMHAYNDRHQEIEVTTQSMTGGSWVNTSRRMITYNGSGLELENRYEEWSGTAWILKTGSQIAYEMDGERVHVMTAKEWNATTSAWVNQMRETFSYTGSDMHYASLIMDMWDNAWVPSLKMEYTWSGDHIAKSLDYAYSEGAWTLNGKTEYEYQGETSTISTVYASAGADNWAPTSRTSLLYDTHGNPTLNQMEMFMGSWTVISATRFQLTYSGNNLTQRITQTYSMFEPAAQGGNATVTWKNTLKQVFSNFASLSTDIPQLPEAGISIFPNPAGKQATVRLTLVKTGAVTLQVVSMTGQTVSEEIVAAGGTEINHLLNLGGLRTGSYLLIARDEQGNEIGKTRIIKDKQ